VQRPKRHVRVVVPVHADAPGVIRITVEGQEPIDYVVRCVPCDWPARGFELTKVGSPSGERYAVLLEGEGGTCECKGFLRWNKCKHRDGLQALLRHGLL
jgi:hypothetical protein